MKNRLIPKDTDFEWPQRSPDLIVPDFFLGGTLREKNTFQYLKLSETSKLQLRIKGISKEMLSSVTENFVKSVYKCYTNDGNRLTDVIFKR